MWKYKGFSKEMEFQNLLWTSLIFQYSFYISQLFY